MPKLLCTDLDGTLFFPRRIRHCICKKNRDFLKKWIDAGNKVVLVSSRSHNFTERLEKEIDRPVDFINCTSAEIYCGGKKIREQAMDNYSLKRVLREIDLKFHPRAYLLTSEKWPIVINDNGRVSKFMKFFYKVAWFFMFSYREKYIISNEVFNEEVEHGKVYKIMIFFGFGKNKNKISKNVNKRLREEYPQIESAWTSIINELTAKDVNKGIGIQYYANYCGIDPKDVYVVGDSGNDIPMFNAFYENSYCMRHSYPSVKKYAHYQIARVYKLKKVLKGEKNE